MEKQMSTPILICMVGVWMLLQGVINVMNSTKIRNLQAELSKQKSFNEGVQAVQNAVIAGLSRRLHAVETHEAKI
jgi:hypothetical protein